MYQKYVYQKYIGQKSLLIGLLLPALFSASTVRGDAQGLGVEVIPAGEAEDSQRIAEMLKAKVTAQAADGSIAKRDAHTKHHGCVRGTFKVLPEGQLPADLAVGVFQPNASYKAWVRLSNGTGKVQDDKEKDGRGMAVKIIGVPGAPLLNNARNLNGEATMDFLMINHPEFFIRNVRDYVGFFENLDGRFGPIPWLVRTLKFRELEVINTIREKPIRAPLSTRYFSMVPSALGTGAVSPGVKYSAAPCVGEGPALSNALLEASPDALRVALRQQMAAGEVCYDFYIQKQTNSTTMPIEDSTTLWLDEGASAFRKVAELRIPAQTFETEAQDRFCENLSMNPWHATTDHRPLGGVQRARKIVYETISNTRHSLNQAPQTEPTGDERF